LEGRIREVRGRLLFSEEQAGRPSRHQEVYSDRKLKVARVRGNLRTKPALASLATKVSTTLLHSPRFLIRLEAVIRAVHGVIRAVLHKHTFQLCIHPGLPEPT
jgi:hypothetical protein